MKGLICDQFQDKVEETLVRNNDLLDILSKLQQTNSNTNRAVTKSITSCGCLSLNYDKIKNTDVTKDDSDTEILLHNKSLTGDLCVICKEKIVSELGNHFFYLAALCNKLDLDMFDTIIEEYDRLTTLGKFNLY